MIAGGARREMRRFSRARRGAVLVEFAISSVVFLVVLISAVELGIELFARQSTQYATNVAADTYARTGSLDATRNAVEEEIPGVTDRCIAPIDVRLFDTIAGSDLTSAEAGRTPTGTAADDTAAVARLTLTCRWSRLTPIVRSTLGPRMRQSYMVFTRMREE